MSVELFSEAKGLEALFIFVDEQRKVLGKIQDKDLLQLIQRPLSMDFKGKLKEYQVLYPSTGGLAKRVILLGAGDAGKVSGNTLRTLGATTVQLSKALGVTKRLGLLVPPVKKLNPGQAVQALREGSNLGQLNFDRFKTDKKEEDKIRYAQIDAKFFVNDRKDLKAAQAFEAKGRVISEGVNWGRRLIMTPGGDLYPDVLVKEAQKMVSDSPSKAKIKAQYWTTKELVKNKFGGVLGVGQGSDNPPRFIVLEYSAGKKGDKPVVLVGKGITFDSGGLSLKPPQGQETMKYDMAGSATVLSVFKIATDLKWPVNLVVLVPTAENMPSGKAIRPGDILRMASGKTVEVLNTDAEGRLILADALHYGSTEYDAKAIIDVATLTGACAMAVGEAAAGIFSNSGKLQSALLKTGQEVQENLWPLPQFDDFYAPTLKSDVADLKNIGSREAGASTASIFLRHFVKSGTPWAHLDIAGCGWYDAPRDFITSKGASGVPIRLLASFVENASGAKF